MGPTQVLAQLEKADKKQQKAGFGPVFFGKKKADNRNITPK